MNPLSRRTTTLHRLWLATTAQLLLMVLVLGGIALATSAYDRAVFRRTAGQLDRKMGLLVRLDDTMRDFEVPALTLVYTVDPTIPLEEHWVAYRDVRIRMEQHLAEALLLDRSPAWTDMVERTRDAWVALDEGIVESAAADRAEVAAARAANIDPFADVWPHRLHLLRHRAELGAQAAADMRTAVTRAGRIQTLLQVGIATAVVLSLLTSALAARRFRRQVVRPTRALQEAALAMRVSDLDHVVQLPTSTVELADLADTLNATATWMRHSHDRLRDQALTDGLTGLPNRGAFVERLRDAMATGEGAQVAVLFVDLDDFKEVNDSLGHAAGDDLLQAVAQRLRSAVRSDGMVARLGGDEFAVVLACDADQDIAATTASEVADRALRALSGPFRVGGERVDVGCSIGVAVRQSGLAEECEELLRNADFAMYMAKGRGKNCVERFVASMHDEVLGRLELKGELARAADAGELRLHHQPIFEIGSGALVGFESLVRWDHPRHGLLAPADFIGLAEETGDIGAIGGWVLDAACSAASSLAGSSRRPLRVSVNVSAIQLAAPGFREKVLGALARHGLDPSRLVLEITERVAVADPASVGEVLSSLRAEGVQVALDDFGMGFSSLRHLHDLPIDIVKIDRSFVVDTDPKSRALLEAIVSMARRLGLGVVAEGIETEEDLERLGGLGPMAGQGYLLARPLALADALALAHCGRWQRGGVLA